MLAWGQLNQDCLDEISFLPDNLHWSYAKDFTLKQNNNEEA